MYVYKFSPQLPPKPTFAIPFTPTAISEEHLLQS